MPALVPPLTTVITSTATRSNPARHGDGINYNGEPIKKRGYQLGLGLHWPLGARLDLTSGLSWNHLSLKNQIDAPGAWSRPFRASLHRRNRDYRAIQPAPAEKISGWRRRLMKDRAGQR
jgi:hypothetical protein